MTAVFVVPSRGRPHNITRLVGAWQATCTAGTRLCVVTDDDDPSDWPQIPASVGWHETGPARRIGPILNDVGVRLARSGEFDAVGFMGDDHLPVTTGWDRQLTETVRAKGGVAYGNDLIQGQALPTSCLIDAKVVAHMGMAPPGCQHLFLDNYWLELGRVFGLTYLPDVIVQHKHPIAGTAPSDEGYARANSPEVWEADENAFNAYMADQFAIDATRTRDAIQRATTRVVEVAAGSVTVCIPSIPPRSRMLAAAIASVLAQSRPADQIRVGIDHDRQGPVAVRNRLGLSVDTDWIAWLDDDDLLGPDHLQVCLQTAAESGADVVYPWFTVAGGTDPFPQHFGRPWDPDEPVQTTITTLMRADWFRKVGGFATQPVGALMPDGNRAGEDFDLICRLNRMGARIVHAPVRTWTWQHHAGNTSGLTHRW